MFDWLARLVGRRHDTSQQDQARARAARAARRSLSRKRDGPTEPAPLLPEVVGEGNTQADWSEWEDSMNALDSRMGGFADSQRVYERDDEERYTRPGKLAKVPQAPDAFGNINKNRDI